MPIRILHLVVAWFVLVVCVVPPQAGHALELPKVFGDHMVLQRHKPVPVWGWAEPGHAVAVSFGSGYAETQADDRGRWSVELPAMPASYEPRVLTVRAIGENGEPETVKRSDVLVGEVWLCGGQSNMEWPLRLTDGAETFIAASDRPHLRMFNVGPNTASAQPQDRLPGGRWARSDPGVAAGFSAVGYHFGVRLQEALDVPVGLIGSNWGGTRIEAWTSRPTLDATPEAKPILDHFDEIAGRWDEVLAQREAERGDRPQYHEDPGDDGQTEQLAAGPGEAALAARPAPLLMPDDFDGVAWYYATVEVPEDWAGRELTLNLGAIDDFDITYVNGVEVGRTGVETSQWWQQPRRYTVPAELANAGETTIAVRVFDRYADGGLAGPAEAMKLFPSGDDDAEAIDLSKWWAPRYATRLDPGAITGPANFAMPYGPGHVHAPAQLYNAMIHPLTPFALRGAVWYQGESNAGRSEQYRALMPAMIQDWRQAWGAAPFAEPTFGQRDAGGGDPLWFFMVQLADFTPFQDQPVESGWAELRDAQFNTLRHVGRTGMAVITDIGDPADIHPRNKHDVGDRLARWALVDTYGQRDVVKSGPLFREAFFTEGQAVVRFDLFGSPLAVREGQENDPQGSPELGGFTLAGADRVWHKAQATIDGDVVRVTSDAVPQPVAVRYGWQHNPADATLINAEGLPASPFRSDDWPGVTANNFLSPP